MTMKLQMTFLMLSVLTSLFAQKDEAAKRYLEKISGELDSGKALEIQFDYTREDLQDESTFEGSGTLFLMGEKYKIDLGEAIIWFDGEKQYSLQTSIEEVYISVPDPDNREFMFSDPIRLLRNYDESFKYRLAGETDFKEKRVDEIQLFPEELGGPYALIKLFFSQEDAMLKGIFIRHKKGILYTMDLLKMEQISPPETAFFQFNAQDYPHADVIELLN